MPKWGAFSRSDRVIVSKLFFCEFGRNDHREGAPYFTFFLLPKTLQNMRFAKHAL